MFYAIPLEDRPSWRNPPWMTLLLILVNVLLFWGPQRSEERQQQRAADFYAASVLARIEIPRFVQQLAETGSPWADKARLMQKHGATAQLLQLMEMDADFQARLGSGQLVDRSDPDHAQWQQARARYEELRPEPFTRRWAQSYAEDGPPRPWTWITAAFLHASPGHLLGNMLFLFMFGFSLELALGRTTYLVFYLLGALGASALAAWAYAGQGSYGLGASGAVSALMAMYAVMYRLRRIRFFYQLLFYFNYVRAPALILLPAWIVSELLQHLLSGRGVAYMAHLGGLLTGAVLMGAFVRWGQRWGLGRRPASPAAGEVRAEARARRFEQHLLQARRLSQALDMENALSEWRAAAQLQPEDREALRGWFGAARFAPASEDFHRAARRIFRLKTQDADSLLWQHACYVSYLELARPGIRIAPEDMARLVRRFTRARKFDDAEKLGRVLVQTAPDLPELGETLGMLVNGLLQQGLEARARDWLPQLKILAPAHPALKRG
ncbi:rhomboid family intramembrane serine protease [Comamonas composti]|uniref:rhomboid family intramembrane serine protease n=1 Tax=Comamonas composti TaxID=408558 RepID=UPI0003FA1301|nr:rhomboid family intramembrane serine protease [Comamonas composti]